ncbi:MAG: hypothetical protein LBS96_08065 [Oscillospiraceae bacterium]|jgi:hypothetical protein|nr:hypothetical protein [Oscillospiraceae bacterium]
MKHNKNFIRAFVAVLLSVCLLLGGAAPAAAASTPVAEAERVLTRVAENAKIPLEVAGRDVQLAKTNGADQDFVLDSLMGVLGHVLNIVVEAVFDLGAAMLGLLPRSNALPSVQEYVSENFYAGSAARRSEPLPGAVWRMGYDRQLLTPADYGEHLYYKGGSGGAPWGLGLPLEGKLDDLYVRTVAVDAGSGTVLFAVLDAVGISNADVRVIRAALEPFAKAHGIISVNVSATHTHSGIDTQGAWGWMGRVLHQPLDVLRQLAQGGIGSLVGTDPAFMEFLTAQTVKSMENAVAAMQPGKLYFAQKSITEPDGTPRYFQYRGIDLNLINDVNRLRFEPAPGSGGKPILIANFGVHSETIGVDDEEKRLSADFIPYMEAVVNAAGDDFIFIQGALGEMVIPRRAPSNDDVVANRWEEARRYGEELGYVLLGLSMTQAECEATVVDKAREAADLAAAPAGSYSPWYADWVAAPEQELEPILNIAHKELLYYSDNSVMNMASRFPILNLIALRDPARPNETVIVTEVGYLELGRTVRVLLSPGETAPELIVGGDTLRAATTFRREDFPFAPLNEAMGDGEVLLVFDLINDAAGYITPDNDYGLMVTKYYKGEASFNTIDLMFSPGHTGASAIIGAFLDLYAQTP